MKEQEYGSWAFIIGVVIAIILGLFGDIVTGAERAVAYVLIVIGLIVGMANMRQREVFNFLVSAIALLAVGAAGLQNIELIGRFIEAILRYIIAFVAPATLVISLKAIYDLSYRKK